MTFLPQSLASLVTRAGAGLVFDFPAFGHRIVRKVPSRATNDTFALAEVVAAPSGGVPLHVHAREEETFYILEGRFSFGVGDDTVEAGPGETVFGPRLIPHSWLCVGDTPGRMMVLVTPGHFENFLAELTQVPPPSDPAAQSKLAALCARFEIGFGPSSSSGENIPFAPLTVPKAGGHFFELGNHRGWAKVGSSHNGGAFLLIEVEADPNGGVPPHIHTREDETFYILEGRFGLMIGNRVIEAGPGDTVFSPRNIMHNWRCISDTPGRALAVVTPGANFEAFAREMAQRQFAPDAVITSPAAASELMAMAERYGMEMMSSIK